MQTLVLIAAIITIIAAIVVMGFIIWDYVETRTVESLSIVLFVVLIAIGIAVAYFGSRYVT